MSTLNNRANLLADRLLLGARELAAFSEALSEEEWNAPVFRL